MFRTIPITLTLVAGIAVAAAASVADTAVPYPKGYRDWHHVKSMVILPGHPLADPFAGIHHVYANDKARAGLKSGQYADGAVLVFDLLGGGVKDNAVTEGPRKLVGVMHRNARRFAATGGWGFEGFAGDTQDKRLVNDGGRGCFACHAAQKEKGFVYSTSRP
jgi:hypothetical protein